MSATNRTTYYDLPIFIGTDVPSWLGDWNNAMDAIDTAIQEVDSKAQSAQTTASSTESGLAATNENVTAQAAELETIKKAVQNYDSILNFEQVNFGYAVNNLSDSNHNFMMVQNTNKTLSAIKIYANFKNPLNNPTKYTWTSVDGTTCDFFDLFTVEDNCFNLNQGSLPNGNINLWLGNAITWLPGDTPSIYGRSIEAWFDGATTHIGFRNDGNLTMTGRYVCLTASVFLSGSVYQPTPEA